MVGSRFPAPRFDRITVEDGDATRTALAVPADLLLAGGFPGETPSIDASDILQAVLNDVGGLPDWLTGKGVLRFLRRTLDLGGRTYKVSKPLDISQCQGVRLINGAFWVDPTKPFNFGRAVLESLTGELRGFELSVSIQCNHAANGINIQGLDSCRFIDCFVYGWGKREFGFKLGPAGYSCSSIIRGGALYGYADNYPDNPVATRTAIGLISDAADLNVFEIYIHGGVENVRISSSTYLYNPHIWNGAPGAEDTALPSNVNARFIGGGGGWIGGQSDNGCIVCEGQVQFIKLRGIEFISNQTKLDYCILLKATAANQALADSIITDCSMAGPYDRFISIDQSAGSYTGLTKFLVENNVQRTYRAGYPGVGPKLCATKGTATFYIQAASFVGNSIKLDMRRFLLCPWISEPMLTFSPPLLFGGTIGQIKSYTYDPTTGLATVNFTAPADSNSQLQVTFDQAYEYSVVAAPPEGTTVPVAGVL